MLALMPRDERGYSTGTGLVAMVAGLVIVVVVLMFAVGSFSGGDGSAGSGASTGTPSILSPSSAETQIKLCSEGRPSSYGNPPTNAQQAACIRDLIGEVSGSGGSSPTSP